MKTITLDIVKKNRVYFKCMNESGYEVKLKVTHKSETLSLGKQELLVRDCSVRTKYGTDIIYDLESEVKEKGIVTLKCKYNIILVEKCKNLGGRWDAESKSWVFSRVVEDKVEELELEYNSDLVNVEITAKRERNFWQGPAHFNGYVLAKAFGRDSGARLADEVALISGKISSGGSMKNWTTVISDGAVFRLAVPRNIVTDYEDWDIKLLGETKEEHDKIFATETVVNAE